MKASFWKKKIEKKSMQFYGSGKLKSRQEFQNTFRLLREMQKEKRKIPVIDTEKKLHDHD
jgi:hypothetical protein